MYRILCDNTLLCDSRIDELALIEPIVELEENRAGSFSFTIPPEHPRYDLIKQRKSVLEVYQDDELIFCGVCVEISKDFFNQKSVVCEGELTYFNDSVQRPARYQNITVRALLQAYINNHNAQVDDYKKFAVGIVTVSDPNDSLYCYTNMESTMECLQKDLVEDLGGFFRIRHKDGTRYLDYLADSQNTSTQVIRLGENLMDFTSNISLMDIATAVIPLGVTLETTPIEGLEVKLTIADANNGCDYIYNQEAVDNYGWIYKTIEFNNVNSAEILKTKAKKYLTDIQFDNMVIEASAIDLHLVDEVVESFKLSDNIRVVSRVHGLDRYFRLTKMKICLSKPENNVITLGKDAKPGLSSKTVEISDEIKKLMENEINPSEILNHAKDNATELITNAMNGFVYKTHDELFIMDTDNPETATRVWRWNINGLGYSSSGIKGPYGLAMTMDGRIVADYIATGTMSADRVKGGIFEVGGTGYGKDGKIEVKNAEGTTLITLDKNGMTLAAGQKISWNNISNAPSIPSKMSELENDENYITDENLEEISTEITKNAIKTEKISCNQLCGGSITLGGDTSNPANIQLFSKENILFGKWGVDGVFQQSKGYEPMHYKSRGAVYCQNIVFFDHSKKGYFRLYFQNVKDFNAMVGIVFVVCNNGSNHYVPICFNTSQLNISGRYYCYDVSYAQLTVNTSGSGSTHQVDGFFLGYYPNIDTTYGIEIEFVYMEILDENKNITNDYWKQFHAGTESFAEGYCLDTEAGILTFNKLQITGSAIETFDDYAIKGIQAKGNSWFFLKEQADYDAVVFELSNEKFMHLGVYNDTSTSSANVRINKDGTFHRYSSSSRRYKENITKNIESDLDPTKLYDIDICQFKYKKDYLSEDDERYNKNVIGFIAEDLYEKYPICCDLDEGVPESPNYNMLIAPMLKLIQEQNERLKKLEKEVLQDG